MKRLIAGIILPLVLVILMCGSVFAMDDTVDVGEVLFHQDFSLVSKSGGAGLDEYGLRFGSAGSTPEEMSLTDGSLSLKTGSGNRLYLLLCDTDKTDSFTGEFTFRFVEPESSRAYLAFMLTCRGEEPTNISSVVIRADGTVDDFSEPTREMKKAITSGEAVSVKIPIESGVLSEMTLTAGEKSCTLKRSDVLLVSSGSNGFVMRNTGVELDEIYIVHGAHYAVKTGYYADNTYSAAVEAEYHDVSEGTAELSPETGEGSVGIAVLVSSFVGAKIVSRRKRFRL